MSRMNVAVVGLGWWGKQIVRSLGRSKERFDLVAVVDPKPPADAADIARENGCRLEADYAATLADPGIEGVILTSPNAFHEDQAVRGFAAGKAVFCEKPLTMTAVGARRMVEAAAAAGKVLGIGHELRYIEPFEALFKVVGDGRLGRLLSMEANLSHNVFQDLPKDNWRKNPSPEFSPAGLYTGTGIHMTDMMCLMAGTPVEVRAETDTLVYEKPTEDYVRAKVLFENGVHGMFSALSCTPYYCRFTAFGEEGWAEVVGEHMIDLNRPMHLIVSTAPGERSMQSWTPSADLSVKANLIAWADANQGRGNYRFTPKHLVDNTAVFEAIVASSRNGGAAVKL